ncbi:MAG: alpha/beta fold hydrolase [Parvibaculum sp.]|uniref:alpha/beta hydrolase family protein n=1 Tax=Parvibaculum sp. TaxID=2024848 RepID=UPI002ABC5998|nr:alpha/beta hydrolase [Parvibaculum sp.]MDZ4380414.1 alpha/beta fold hydrolase [Parvibaculum sp.]
MNVRALMFGLVALLLAACGKPPEIEVPEGVEITPLESYSRIESWFLLKMAGVEGVSVPHAVDIYRVVHSTRPEDGEAVRASGLMALPRGVAPKRIVSFQHGTTTSRDEVPSKPDLTGVAASILFAGNGYMLIAPDYLGLGESEGVHGYYVASDHARAVTGLLAAVRQLPDAPSAPIFLSGFSQGGHVSLAAMRQLEAEGETVLGAAPVAAALDVRNISLGMALGGGSKSHALYLAYMAWGYAHYYGRPLDSVLTEDYAAKVETLYGTPHSPDEIIEGLPADPRVMFTPEFLEAFDTGGEHWMLEAIAANGVGEWTPKAPVRLFYGDADKDVVPEEAIAGAERFRARGSDVEAVSVGEVGHDPSLLLAAPHILEWLGELEARIFTEGG